MICVTDVTTASNYSRPKSIISFHRRHNSYWGRERERISLPQLSGFLFIPHLAKNDPFQNLPWKSAHGWRPALGFAVALFTAPCARTRLGAEAGAQSHGCGHNPSSPGWRLCNAFMSTIRLGSPHKELQYLCTQNLGIGPRILNLIENLQPRYFSKCTRIFLRCARRFLSITGFI